MTGPSSREKLNDVADQRAETGTNGGTEPGVTDDEEARRHYAEKISPFVERFAADLTEAGMQRMASRVFACLLASEEGALTSAELSERLQASPAAISGAVRYLAQVNMISRQRDPGSRRERYLLHHDVWYSTLLNRDNLMTRWRATLHTGARAIGEDTPGDAASTKARSFSGSCNPGWRTCSSAGRRPTAPPTTTHRPRHRHGHRHRSGHRREPRLRRARAPAEAARGPAAARESPGRGLSPQPLSGRTSRQAWGRTVQVRVRTGPPTRVVSAR